LFICISIHYLATCCCSSWSCYSCCWCKGKPNRKERNKLGGWKKKKICNSNDMMKTKHDPLFSLSPLRRTIYTQHSTQTFPRRRLLCSSFWTCENESNWSKRLPSACISNALTQSTN
jgi:hypothetical protein